MTHDETKANKTGQLVLINHGKCVAGERPHVCFHRVTYCFGLEDLSTLDPTYNEFGYKEYPSTTSRFFASISLKKVRLL